MLRQRNDCLNVFCNSLGFNQENVIICLISEDYSAASCSPNRILSWQNQSRLDFLWQIFMQHFRDYRSLAKVRNLLVKFSEDLNASVATMTSQETWLSFQTTQLRCPCCSPTEDLLFPLEDSLGYAKVLQCRTGFIFLWTCLGTD